MRSTRALVVLVVLLGLVAAACGNGDGVETYENYGISFRFPSEWEVAAGADVRAESGNELWSETVGIDATSVVIVAAYELNSAVTEDNIGEAEPQIVAAMEALSAQAGGEIVEGPEDASLGGLPGFRFLITATTPDETLVRSRVMLAFDGTTQYFVNCQHTEENRQEIERGCDMIVDSFSVADAGT